MVTFELAADDPWVKRGYGQARIEPGETPGRSRHRPAVRVHRPRVRVRGRRADRARDREHGAPARDRTRRRRAGLPDRGRLGGEAGQRPLDDQASALRPHHAGVALGAGRRAGVGGRRPAPPEEVAVLLPRDAAPLAPDGRALRHGHRDGLHHVRLRARHDRRLLLRTASGRSSRRTASATRAATLTFRTCATSTAATPRSRPPTR